MSSPTIIPRAEHNISRANISEAALKTLYRLKDAGFEAYLVGGGVRDLLLGREPKDFDVATNAHPEEVKDLFRNCILVGRRFRLAHVRYGREVIEVATFRAPHDAIDDADDAGRVDEDKGRILRDNVWGDLESDAWRRDFTVNALYYNVADFSVVDYTGGMADLRRGELHLIGDDAEQRYREDPVRMLRAVRFAAKLGFRIADASESKLFELGRLLDDIPPARLYDEVLKLFLAGHALSTYELLRHYGLFGYLFPQTEDSLTKEHDGFPITFVAKALHNTDVRVRSDQSVTPFFLYAALLWEPYQEELAACIEDGMDPYEARFAAFEAVIRAQQEITSVPRRFTQPVREIWDLQSRFDQRSGKRPLRLVSHPRFRAAYDFLLLRGEAGEALAELCSWWTDFIGMDEAQREMSVPKEDGDKRRRRRRPRRRNDSADGPADGGE
ncbi:MAG: polynucleotide adenylyltransferase PcnB [Gammaproteobacteria bacterium]|nr:polynucleotide adenylyltransferase PcnB [Gammaproteobacteria bacterium]